MKNNIVNQPAYNIFGFIGLIILLTMPTAYADSEGQPTIYGKTYGQWSAKWWQWVRSIPKQSNPLLASGLIDCSIGQSGPVYFLAGTTGDGPVTRECNLPEGKGIFFSALNFMYNNDPADPQPFPNVSEKRQALNDAINLPWCDMNITLDGENVLFSGVNTIVRTQSPTFSLTIGDDDVFDGTAGSTDNEVVSDGHWLMLKNLRRGDHTLHIQSSWCETSPHEAFQDYTYILHVVGR